jgi:hypothetical protein
MTLLWIVATIIAVLVLAFAWGIARLRKSTSQVRDELTKVGLADVPRLCAECQTAFRDHFNETLSLDDYEASAQMLSRRVDDNSLKRVLGRDEFWWYFVLPAGAFLGELLRRHVGAEWKASAEGAPEMRIPVGTGEATTFPFDKIFKQATSGDKGDLYAYLVAARNLESTVAEQISAT